MIKTIEVVDWNDDVLNVTKSEYVKKFTQKLDFLDLLVDYSDATNERRDGTTYYVESTSEEQYSQVLGLVNDMAANEFERLHASQSKKMASAS